MVINNDAPLFVILKSILGHKNTNKPKTVRRSWHQYVSELAMEFDKLGGGKKASSSQLGEYLTKGVFFILFHSITL